MSAITVSVAQAHRFTQPPENRLRASGNALPGAMREQLQENRLRASGIARRRAEEEGADTFFVGERRRSRRLPGAMREQPQERASIDRPSSSRSIQTTQPCTNARATTAATDWRLTDRGIAVVMVIAAVILTVALAVIGVTAIRVTSADYGAGVHESGHDQH